MAKMMLNLQNVRLKRKVEQTIDKTQFGFRKGMATRNAKFVLRTFMERYF